MRYYKKFIIFSGALLIGGLAAQNLPAQNSVNEPPRVFLMDAQKLQKIKQAKDKTYDAAVAAIESNAEKALRGGAFSVTTKSATPPSGDKHDYISQAPYFWADPGKKDGLPYIRRDGERNPEIKKVSRSRQSRQNDVRCRSSRACLLFQRR